MTDNQNIYKNEPTRKLSPIRLILLFVVILIIGYFSVNKWESEIETIDLPDVEPWFGAYVDVTSKPTYPFEQLGSTQTTNIVLAFIVSSKEDPCVPTWGTFFTPDEVTIALDLDRRIARFQQQEGKIAISFGGALNSELASKCEDKEKLLNAYESVINRYNIDTIDIDLERENLSNTEASVRRAEVIAQLQTKRRSEGKNLAVWLTIPVLPHGLTKEGTDAVSIMLKNGVDLAGVNIMTMDYGGAKDPNQTMFESTRQALIQTQRQLDILYRQVDINLSTDTLWRKLGATPMIGQNDVVDEVFTLDDAKNLNEFALSMKVGRVSMWSANRDIMCGENYVDVKVVSDSCSGVKEEKYSFTYALSEGFNGDITQNATIITIDEPIDTTQIIDDPQTSPYQIWQETGAYPKGVKVVWRGFVYEAKWWTKGDVPDNPVLQSWETPWQLMGPVLPGEKPIQQPTLPEGTYPKWSGTIIYEGGERVLFEGIPFQAKWWNQGQSPAASAANPDSSPWLPLSQEQIEKILNEITSESSSSI